MWYRIVRRRRKKRASTVTKHYLEHKETARALIHERLKYWNQFYGYQYNRVSIKNQRRCWGSCSELGNLNFSYKILFLPSELADYIILHELCHLEELNHSQAFWQLIEREMPDYKARMKTLRQLERGGTSIKRLESLRSVDM